MTKIKFDIQLMKFMTLFESITRSKVKDVIKTDDQLIFIVNPGEIGRAIGKKASNIKKLEKAFKRDVRVVEYSDELENFVRNVIIPLKAEQIDINDRTVTIKSPDTKTRGYLIGRGGSRLRHYESIVKRYFDIDEIKVV